jgi:hypothetical protein
MPDFLSPGWLLLLPALAVAAWSWRHLGITRPLRLIGLVCGILALADPVSGWLRSGMDLWVLVDRSDSCAVAMAESENEWMELLRSSKPGHDDRLRVVHFADGVSQPDPDEGEALGGGIFMTRLKTAIQSVLAQISGRRPSRVLAITDGFATESLEGVTRKALAAGVPIDVRLIPPPGGEDLRIAALAAPSRVLAGEPFVLDVAVAGMASKPARVVVYRDGRELASREVPPLTALQRARSLQFTDRMVGSGAYRYEARVSLAGDTVPGNDSRSRWVEVVGGARVLLVTRYQQDPVARFLRAQGFEVDLASDPQALHVGSLASCRVVLFNNVGAFDVPRPFLEALDFFVREQGGGLVMFGGKNSFGSGGYFESPIDALLPVSMELKAEHRKLAVAMAIVMDRSGSMGATVAGGMSKMQLADEGAARAVELLGVQDVVAVYAVDSKAHEMVPPLSVGENRQQILDRVRRIQSGGGGIFMFEGLSAAVEALEAIQVGQRHIILFSDAADTEKPGAYKMLLRRFTEAGGTVSVIGLGTTADPDAKLLEDTAKLGGGRIFFTTDAKTLPNIFAQETVTVARSSFLEEPVGLQATGRWIEIAGGVIQWPEQVDGYNLSYLREEATAHLLSTDEYDAPLVATARRGLGRSAAVSFPTGGDHSQSVREWTGFGDFIQTLGRWLAGEETPPGVALRTRTSGTDLIVDLYFADDSRDEVMAAGLPSIVLAHGEGGVEPISLRWERLAPGNLRATRSLVPGLIARGAVQLGASVLPFGPIVVGGEIEWDFDPAKPADLLRVAKASGGRELDDLGQAWQRPPSESGGRGLRSLLALGMLLCILGDALVSRTGSLFRRSGAVRVQSPRVAARTVASPEARSRRFSAVKSVSSEQSASESRVGASGSTHVEQADASTEARAESRSSLLRRAKARRR